MMAARAFLDGYRPTRELGRGQKHNGIQNPRALQGLPREVDTVSSTNATTRYLMQYLT